MCAAEVFIMTENKKKKKKESSVIQAGIGGLTVILVILILMMMNVVSSIQGTARVVNYAGLVRGKTQRIVKLENAGQPQDDMLKGIEDFINGLRRGDKELNLVRLDDRDFQNKMQELDEYFQSLRQEIMLVRQKGYQNTEIIAKSEYFFGICDEATGLAEIYSQKKASSLKKIETYITVDIVFLMLLIGYEFIKALRYAALNRALQSKVYLDEATGLLNKNKCEELLNAPGILTNPVGICSFDLNNLRRINNSMGHDMGNEYIRRFAVLLRESMPAEHFVGRDGGDEFIAIVKDADHSEMQKCLTLVKNKITAYSEEHPEFPISYAVGYALAQDYENCTMRELYTYADKNMYINKNHVKREEAAAEKRLDYRLLKMVNVHGRNFSDVLYCDAKQDTYRLIRASEDFFLAADGNYSGAVQQIVEEQVEKQERRSIWKQLQVENLETQLDEAHNVMELQYRHNGKDYTGYSRLTMIFVDRDNEDKLHHFLVAFETIHHESRGSLDAKQQLTQYYEQLKQSILENDSYVDALLETADTIYAVNLTHDRMEQDFQKKDEQKPMQSFLKELQLPCSYDGFCLAHTACITPETLEGYRLIDSSGKLLKRFASGEKQVTVEYCEKNTDGNFRWVQKTVLMTERLVYDAEFGRENAVVHGIILLRDTTGFHAREQKEHARLQAAYEKVTTANREKSEFLSRMSHDIRTPINGVMGMLEIIKKNRENPEKVDDCLRKIRISSEYLLSLINDVLDMSKLETGHITLAHTPFDLSELLQQVCSMGEAQIAETNLTYHPHLDGIYHTRLVGSPLHLRQILLNLFSNAVKYNKENGTIDTWVREVASDADTATFEFKITDTGIGMSAAFVENELFEPFTQEKSDARTQYQGTGLGMSIVKELIEKMHGSIQTKSTPDVGTTFVVTLPFEQDKSLQPVQEHQSAAVKTSIEGMKILLVEDNSLNMEIAEFFLNDMGAQVVKAWNGMQALGIFAASEPGDFDCILMDIMMPVMDGLEATRQIRSLDRPDAKTVCILAITANAFSDDIMRSKQAGMNAHLSKPLTEDALKEALVACN